MDQAVEVEAEGVAPQSIRLHDNAVFVTASQVREQERDAHDRIWSLSVTHDAFISFSARTAWLHDEVAWFDLSDLIEQSIKKSCIASCFRITEFTSRVPRSNPGRGVRGDVATNA
jgi:hypothetical protein